MKKVITLVLIGISATLLFSGCYIYTNQPPPPGSIILIDPNAPPAQAPPPAAPPPPPPAGKVGPPRY